MKYKRDDYYIANTALIDWVLTHRDKVDDEALCAIMLGLTMKTCFNSLGREKAIEAVNEYMNEQIKEHAKQMKEATK
tara:strand:- start:53 stop:283 length:231 start_codon:yes stop_codon:yes gene_type:complete